MLCLWEEWSIQVFVLLGLIFQMVPAVLGSRRKISSAKTIRIVIWATYSLAPHVLTLALNKLTSVSLIKSKEEYYTELIALLGPLTLLLLGGPDSITAYSVEDNLLALSRLLNLIITFPLVVWILVRSWKTSSRMILCFAMFVAGIMEYGAKIWALYSVHHESKKMKLPKVVSDEEWDMSSALMNFPKDYSYAEWVESFESRMLFARMNLPKDVPHLEIFFKAYFRFDCLKPHLMDWLKPPVFMRHPGLSINDYSPEEVFLITEMELGFMYDVLYTKAPVLQTTAGITLRIISNFSLLLALGGFMRLFFKEHLRDPHVIYTFVLLIGTVLLETYQLFKLFCSDWAIIKLYAKYHEKPMVLKLLKSLVKRSLKKERWSNAIPQFNFLDFCLSDEQPWLFGIIKLSDMANKLSKYFATHSVPFPLYLKEILLEDMKKIETKSNCRPFTKRGQWTLGIHESLDKLKWSIVMAFDRSVIVWHIATQICNYSCPEDSIRNKASKLISDYMMFLLVQHPHILSLTPAAADITFSHAYTKFMKFLNRIPQHQRGKGKVLEVLSGPERVQESDSERSLESVITRGWNVLEEAQKLARELGHSTDTWELICCVWVEMLCFAAYNCQQYQHTELVRRGGEIITQVWLLLSHTTDKLNIAKYMDRDIEI
ncbi:uncharacterized protein LOC115736076 [Rhodamnia argentea]|uniref:Uncharacterized protein LOC115736076 n=1 Tax=Rhodamnia argentea TaxID=178133 RepID=A0A8B8NLT6_9MYRT|nr:uncharacterized protein LOC115736076 [Rhodamnia argentea]